MKLKVGQRLSPKQPWIRDLYGAQAVVVRIYEAVDRPHPGFVHRTLIDLDTDAGVDLRGWSSSNVKAHFKPTS